MAGLGTGRSSARPISATSASATSALGPCPAPRNLTTYVPSPSTSTTPGSEPPSRSGTTYRVPSSRGSSGAPITVDLSQYSERHMPTALAMAAAAFLLTLGLGYPAVGYLRRAGVAKQVS